MTTQSPQGIVESPGRTAGDRTSQPDGATKKSSVEQDKGVTSSNLNSKYEANEGAIESQTQAVCDQILEEERLDSLGAGATNADSQLEDVMNNLTHLRVHASDVASVQEVPPLMHESDPHTEEETTPSPSIDPDETLVKERVDSAANNLNLPVEDAISHSGLEEHQNAAPHNPEELASIDELQPVAAWVADPSLDDPMALPRPVRYDQPLANERVELSGNATSAPDTQPEGAVGGSDSSSDLNSMDLLPEADTLDGSQLDFRTSRPVQSRYC